MIRLYYPSCALLESMYSMFFAPLICCSIGAATDCTTTSALAPANVVATCTCGGTICGYCEIGRLKPASAPASVMISEMTVEKTGRSMKKLNIYLPAGAAGGGPPGTVTVCAADALSVCSGAATGLTTV